jgi:lipopolysaccharide export system permease protein
VKKVDILILKSFIGPFAATFIVSIFLFLMHFIWKYIDDLVGKGLEWHVVARLLFFATANLVSLALPLAVLISSLMCFGNITESYEMVALKSAGTSLYRALLPAFIVMGVFAYGTFLMSNYLIPKANLEFYSLLYDVRHKKPAFNIKEGVFYNEIENFSIKVGKKEEDNQTIHDVIIYEKKGFDNRLNLVKAKHGTMKLSDDEKLLHFTLFDGVRYEEMTKEPNYVRRYPHNIMEFDKQVLSFDLSEFELQMTEKELFKEDYRMMHLKQLEIQIDSLGKSIDKRLGFVEKSLNSYQKVVDTLPQLAEVEYKLEEGNHELEDLFHREYRSDIMATAVTSAKSMKSIIESNQIFIKGFENDRRKFHSEWHRKFTLSAVIIVLFLIAAPLGTIIRKGGMGMPMVIAVLMFILYYAVNISGEKMAKEGVWTVANGMWFSTICLLPIGFFLTFKASRDSSILNSEVYSRLIRKLTSIKIFDRKDANK